MCLSKEVVLLTWTLRTARMTPHEHAVFINGLVGQKKTQCLETRLTDLTEELRKW